MRRLIALLALLTLCLFCQCKRPTPPDQTRLAQANPPAPERK
jgi:hypothetical protein